MAPAGLLDPALAPPEILFAAGEWRGFTFAFGLGRAFGFAFARAFGLFALAVDRDLFIFFDFFGLDGFRVRLRAM